MSLCQVRCAGVGRWGVVSGCVALASMMSSSACPASRSSCPPSAAGATTTPRCSRMVFACCWPAAKRRSAAPASPSSGFQPGTQSASQRSQSAPARTTPATPERATEVEADGFAERWNIGLFAAAVGAATRGYNYPVTAAGANKLQCSVNHVPSRDESLAKVVDAAEARATLAKASESQRPANSHSESQRPANGHSSPRSVPTVRRAPLGA